MATIYQETFLTGSDKALVLENEEAGRTLEIGDDWTRIRIGALLAVEPDGTNDLTNSQLRFGMSTARDDHAGSLSVDHFYGYFSGASAKNYIGGTAGYQAGGGDPYFTWVQGAFIGLKSGAFVTDWGFHNGVAFGLPATTGTARRFPIFAEYKKVTTTLRMAFATWTDTLTNQDTALSDVVTTLEDVTDFAIAGNLTCNGDTLATNRVTFNDYAADAATNGEITSVQIGFNKVLSPLRIYAVVIARYE